VVEIAVVLLLSLLGLKADRLSLSRQRLSAYIAWGLCALFVTFYVLFFSNGALIYYLGSATKIQIVAFCIELAALLSTLNIIPEDHWQDFFDVFFPMLGAMIFVTFANSFFLLIFGLMLSITLFVLFTKNRSIATQGQVLFGVLLISAFYIWRSFGRIESFGAITDTKAGDILLALGLAAIAGGFPFAMQVSERLNTLAVVSFVSPLILVNLLSSQPLSPFRFPVVDAAVTFIGFIGAFLGTLAMHGARDVNDRIRAVNMASWGLLLCCVGASPDKQLIFLFLLADFVFFRFPLMLFMSSGEDVRNVGNTGNTAWFFKIGIILGLLVAAGLPPSAGFDARIISVASTAGHGIIQIVLGLLFIVWLLQVHYIRRFLSSKTYISKMIPGIAVLCFIGIFPAVLQIPL